MPRDITVIKVHAYNEFCVLGEERLFSLRSLNFLSAQAGVKSQGGGGGETFSILLESN